MFNVRVTLVEPIRHWTWPIAVAALCAAVALTGDAGREALRWQRELLVAEPWRLLTAHVVHLDVPHLLFNYAGLAVLWALVGSTLPARTWSLLLVAGALAISAGLLWTDVHWYVGLSGVLFTLLVAGAILLWREWPVGALFLLGYVAVKSVAEFFGFTTGELVVAEAHWIGAGAGVAAGILCALFRHRRPA
jgi:rhomboid family GlyGly-CTERM serine protease